MTHSITSEARHRSVGQQRLDCLICHHHIDPDNPPAMATFPCHVRAFSGERFNVWRCPDCQTIHCLEVVDLATYYAKYPFAQATLTWPFRIFYRNLSRRLIRFGLRKKHSFLDYGCGNGLFVQYLLGRGYRHSYGYDPYGPVDGYGDPAALEHGPFDYILLQDVLEHVEDPRTLLADMNDHLAPGGYILVGTPNAANLDLNRPEEFLNEVHVPYHLHIYNRESVEEMGRALEWTPVGYYDRPYHDRPLFGMNTRAAKEYQRLLDGSMDAVLEPINVWTALTSARFLYFATVGYWLSFRSDMAIMFHKNG